MSEMVKEIRVYSDYTNVFDLEGRYEIPLYQRAYAWEDKEIIQLIEDVEDVEESSNYYIGSLVVARDGDVFEVVDGQQRLTTLFLLMNSLGIDVKKTLRFACRDKSNYTLDRIEHILGDDPGKYENDRIESGIRNGLSVINAKISEKGFDRDRFLDKLKRVVLYRIEVPENTDLNRYFEIMNTRGEQLEQHDILKATLMSFLDESERSAFATIWDACSDMTGYVQMHFSTAIRNRLFGGDWTTVPDIDWNGLFDAVNESQGDENNKDNERSIEKIIRGDFRREEVIDEAEDKRLRFESIAEFPHFLIHVLKVFAENEGVKSDDERVTLIRELIDDKKLTDTFATVVDHGMISSDRIGSDESKKADFAKRFISYLLVCRVLYDKYVLKREYASDNSDGEWSLKEIRVSGSYGNKRPYFINTNMVPKGGWEQTSKKIHQSEIMIQSALRVSYTSPKVMHWITKILSMVTRMHMQQSYDAFISDFVLKTEDIARDAVEEQFFGVEGGNILGVNTPHIVFNYLDYLLWKGNPEKFSGFVFEFRNSVEHWYPQHPSEGTFEPWKSGVDRFGNLCLIQRNVNSKFSNMSPEAKSSTFQDMIAKGSLKLRLMNEITEAGKSSGSASYYWRDTACALHEDDMINLLVKDVYQGKQPKELFGGVSNDDNSEIANVDGVESADAYISSYSRNTIDSLKGVKDEVIRAIRDTMREYAERGLIYYNAINGNSEYFVFQTKRMDEILPLLKEDVSSWYSKNIYEYWVKFNRDNLSVRGVFELGGYNVPESSMAMMKRIIEIEKPSRDNLEFKYKRVHRVEKHMIDKDGDVYTDTKRYTSQIIQELLEHQDWLIEQLGR